VTDSITDALLRRVAQEFSGNGTAAARRRHPAVDIDDDRVTLGLVNTSNEVEIITSDRELLAVDDVKEILTFTPRPYSDLAGRWNGDDVLRFVQGAGETLTVAEVLALAIQVFNEAMEFSRREHLALVATWTVATYFHLLFLTFPRLSLSGERESGKSKLLALLHLTAFNALLMLNPTPAVLFRLVHEFRATLLLDEVEGLSKEDRHDVLAIINAGYKAGATVARCEGEKRRLVESFAVYGPLALAAIRSPNATTEDRCIPLVLQRGSDRRRLNAEVNPSTEVFARIRAACYRLLLTRWREVRDAYRTVTLPEWLNGRARELWKPLLALAAIADRENGLALTGELLALAREHVAERPGITEEGEALLAVLTEAVGEAEATIVRPGALREALRARLGWKDAPSAETVAAWLSRRFGFPRLGRDRDGAKYEIRADKLREVTERYSPESTVTPSPSRDKSAISQGG
jgi:hypothetical protein